MTTSEEPDSEKELSAAIRQTGQTPRFVRGKNEKKEQNGKDDLVAFGTGLGDSDLRLFDVPDAVQSGQPDQLDDKGDTSISHNDQIPQPANTTNHKPEVAEERELPANATNTTDGFATPSGWSKLWRIERNGDYYIYKLRFTDSAEIPQELRRISRKGGKITSRIESKFAERKGKGRHSESRADAERFRNRAVFIAKRIRKIS